MHPQADPVLDLVGRGRAVTQHGDAAGVVLGLEQARHELQLEGPDQRRGLLQAHVGLEPVRHDVVVLGPPALVIGLAGQRQHALPLLGVGDAVQAEQVRDVALLEADPAVLHPADLGPGGPDLVAGLVGRQPGGLAQAPKLDSQEHPQDGRAAAGLARSRCQPAERCSAEPRSCPLPVRRARDLGLATCAANLGTPRPWPRKPPAGTLPAARPDLATCVTPGRPPRSQNARQSADAVSRLSLAAPIRPAAGLNWFLRPKLLMSRDISRTQDRRTRRSAPPPETPPARRRYRPGPGRPGEREFRTATPPPGSPATSTQLPLGLLAWLLRHRTGPSSAARAPLANCIVPPGGVSWHRAPARASAHDSRTVRE